MNRSAKIFVLHAPQDEYIAEIVEAGFVRSFSESQVGRATYDSLGTIPLLAVLINPRFRQMTLLGRLNEKGCKTAVFGALDSESSAFLGIEVTPLTDSFQELGRAKGTGLHSFDASVGQIVYSGPEILLARNPLRSRFLCRYDFDEEWNNAGYGRVSAEGGPWSISQMATDDGITPIGWVTGGQSEKMVLYAGLQDVGCAAFLWVNRPVGWVDSLEWTLVEEYFSSYGAGRLFCIPRIEELPPDTEVVVTPRIDCDQAIGSASRLCDLYTDFHIPLSVAVLTGLPMNLIDEAVLQRVAASGGCLLSHSVRHLPKWGGSYEAASLEARESAEFLKMKFGLKKEAIMAVSPFHQNPAYAVQALADCGYAGVVGGIIANDPEYLLGRAGRVPFCSKPFIGLSQQCMFHGDCYHRYQNQLGPYLDALEHAKTSRSFFGYLDHPFSQDYQYGWEDEEERVAVHEEWIRTVTGKYPVTWWTIRQCIDYLRQRDALQVSCDLKRNICVRKPDASFQFTVVFEGRSEIF